MQTNKSCSISLRGKNSLIDTRNITTTHNTHIFASPHPHSHLYTRTRTPLTHSPQHIHIHHYSPLTSHHLSLPHSSHAAPHPLPHTHTTHSQLQCKYAKRTESDRIYTFQEHNIANKKIYNTSKNMI